ncbi:MAG: NAD(P)H-binding protein [Solirubrobacteraceae bacterium]|nr:NAD(P)H-binding protein [Solirubrobacteraceae bacterium]
MKKIAVVGGTGTLGTPVVAQLAARGHEVLALSRTAPDSLPGGAQHRVVDLVTGEGLADALAGAEVVIDASNGTPRGAEAVLVDGTRRLLAAERKAGVGHHVGVSIVGIEDVPMGYYRTKVAQEQAIEAGDVPWTILRATQFHDLIGMALEATSRFRMLPGFKAQLQPVDVRDVAVALADLAEGEPRHAREEIVGPEIVELRDLATAWKTANHRHAVVVRAPFPTALGRALRDGGLTDADAPRHGEITFGEWLATTV